MNIRELSLKEFETFSENHPLGNFHQTKNYALSKAEEGYEYEFIGYCEKEIVLAASLILYKKIGKWYYGYAPCGFLIDYTNKYFLKIFTEQLKEYYYSRNFAFIKINPEIAIGTMNKKTFNIEYNNNYSIIDNLLSCGYKKLKNNLYFEALQPRFNVIIPLKEFDINKVNKNTRNKINKGIRKGLYLEKGGLEDIDNIYDLIKNKRNKNVNYYKDLYNVFITTKAIDIFKVKINFKKYLLNAQLTYEKEINKNNYLNKLIITNNNSKTINKKMNSDKTLLSYKKDINEASKFINTNEDPILATAFVIKYKNRVTIYISGFNKKYKRYAANYFLHYALIEYYKKDYKYMDLNGITGDFTKDNPYHGLNDFKLNFNPNVYEYIGEFDLPINNMAYKTLLKNKLIFKEFN